MKTAVIVGALLFFGVSAWASAQERTCCICQTGQIAPDWQKPFFKLGCDKWLADQSGCDSKQTTDDFDQLVPLASACKGGTVKLGYVGHWNTGFSEWFLEAYVLPMANPLELGESVEIDNTACLVMDNVPYLQSIIDFIPLAPGKHIRLEGSQSESIGEFDTFLPGLWEVKASIDTRNPNPAYPRCSDVQNAACITMQEDEQVVCANADQSTTVLTCTNAMETPDPYDSHSSTAPQWVVDATPRPELVGTYSCPHFDDPTVTALVTISQNPGQSLSVKIQLSNEDQPVTAQYNRGSSDDESADFRHFDGFQWIDASVEKTSEGLALFTLRYDQGAMTYLPCVATSSN
jgi:hypothetical protein